MWKSATIWLKKLCHPSTHYEWLALLLQIHSSYLNGIGEYPLSRHGLHNRWNSPPAPSLGERLPLAAVASYVQQVAGALQFARDQRLVHLSAPTILVGNACLPGNRRCMPQWCMKYSLFWATVCFPNSIKAIYPDPLLMHCIIIGPLMLNSHTMGIPLSLHDGILMWRRGAYWRKQRFSYSQGI